MSERYWITGVELGLLKAINIASERVILVEEITDKQFIGNYRTEKEQKAFKKQMDSIQ